MVVSIPVKTKAIASARIKNDNLDSHMLAELLRADLLATVHVSGKQTRELKELLRYRSKLVRDASIINSMALLGVISIICNWQMLKLDHESKR